MIIPLTRIFFSDQGVNLHILNQLLTVFCAVFVLCVLGCFFSLGLALFAGCVEISQKSSRNVKIRQKKSKKVAGSAQDLCIH
jgi:hypothetical protein